MRKQTKIAALVSAAALLAIGASMTASANTWSGVNGTMDWTWVDSQGNPIEEEGWHRGNADWGANSQYYYFSDENGNMVSSQTVEYGDGLYYVDELGRRVTNAWISLDLEDEYEMPDGEVVSSAWYYFGAKGKATMQDADFKAYELIKDTGRTDKGYFVINQDGYMMLGRVDIDGATYYCTQSNDSAYIELPEGQTWGYVTGEALNGWAKMDVSLVLDEEEAENEDYSNKEWFYFEKGKLYKPGVNGGAKTIDGVSYGFDANGVLGKWDGLNVATANNTSDTKYNVYVDSNDSTTVSGNKWEQIGTYDWQYIINARNNDKTLITKGVIFNYNYKGMDQKYDADKKAFVDFDNDGEGYSRMIKVNGKVFLIGPDGKMLTGVQEITPATLYAWGKDADANSGKFIWNHTYEYYVPAKLQAVANDYYKLSGEKLKDQKSYYFNFDDSKDLDGDRGEQLTGRYPYTDDDGNELARIFTTDGVVAEELAMYGEYLYEDGVLVIAQDGAANEAIPLTASLNQYTIKGSKVGTTATEVYDGEEPSTAWVIVDRNGKVKKSSSSRGFAIEDMKYDIKNYVATEHVDN